MAKRATQKDRWALALISRWKESSQHGLVENIHRTNPTRVTMNCRWHRVYLRRPPQAIHLVVVESQWQKSLAERAPASLTILLTNSQNIRSVPKRLLLLLCVRS